MPSNPKDRETNAPSPARKFLGDVWKEHKAHRAKGWIGAQREEAGSARRAAFLNETGQAIRRAAALKLEPTRVETFDEAVQRMGLTEQALESQFKQFRSVHLTLYLFAGALLVYSFWLLLNAGAFSAISVLVASLGSAVYGYIHGFRAWQIQNRRLIRFQDALCEPGTYLVL